MDEALVRVDRSIAQLKLKVDNQNPRDRMQLAQILYQILDYPDLQEASRHEKASKMGNFDLIEDQEKLATALAVGQVSLDKDYICECCGLIIHKNQIPFSQSLENINLGLGTMLYFNNIIYNIFALCAVMVLCSFYFLITNILACKGQQAISCGINGLGLNQKITNADKNSHALVTSSILGIVLVSIWGLIILYKNHVQKKIAFQMEQKFIQASQFTVMIQHFPAKLLKSNLSRNKEIVQKIFKQYEQKVNDGLSYDIAKINIAFNLYLQNKSNQYKKKLLQQQLKQRQQPFKQWIKHRKQHDKFQTPIEERQKMYDEYLKFFKTKYNVKRGFQGSCICDENSQQKVIIFVTMEQSNMMRQIVKDNQPPSLFNFFNLCRSNKFPIQGVKITQAPPPQEIKWTNIGFPSSRKRVKRVLVYFIAFLFLGGSLAMTYGLNQVQSTYHKIWVSAAISAIITLVNFLLRFTITILSKSLHQITQTRVQFNLAFKICLFQILNAIGVPLVALYIAKRQLFGSSGLSSDIFFISLFNSLIPVLDFFDPYFIKLSLRNSIYCRPGKFFFITILEQRLQKFKSQNQFNKIFDQNEFDIGFQYAYTLKTVIFTSFFLCLQPIIVIFGIIGLILIFYVNKYRVLYRFLRPRYYCSTINVLVNQILNISPMIFGLGMLLFKNWQESVYYSKTLILNWVIFGIGAFYFLFPFEILYKIFFKPQYKSIKYRDKIAVLPSQYDRMNLITRQTAIQEFRSVLTQLKEKKQFPLHSWIVNQVQMMQPVIDLRSMIFAGGDIRNTFRGPQRQDMIKKSNVNFRQERKEPVQFNDNKVDSQQHIMKGYREQI